MKLCTGLRANKIHFASANAFAKHVSDLLFGRFHLKDYLNGIRRSVAGLGIESARNVSRHSIAAPIYRVLLRRFYNLSLDTMRFASRILLYPTRTAHMFTDLATFKLFAFYKGARYCDAIVVNRNANENSRAALIYGSLRISNSADNVSSRYRSGLRRHRSPRSLKDTLQRNPRPASA